MNYLLDFLNYNFIHHFRLTFLIPFVSPKALEKIGLHFMLHHLEFLLTNLFFMLMLILALISIKYNFLFLELPRCSVIFLVMVNR